MSKQAEVVRVIVTLTEYGSIVTTDNVFPEGELPEKIRKELERRGTSPVFGSPYPDFRFANEMAEHGYILVSVVVIEGKKEMWFRKRHEGD